MQGMGEPRKYELNTKERNIDKLAIAAYNSYNEKLIQERIQVKTWSFH